MVWKYLNNAFFRHGLSIFSVVAISGYTFYHLVDNRINIKKESKVIDTIGFTVGQSRSINRTRSKDEDPEVTEKLRNLRKAHKQLEKAKLDGSEDYDFKPVPKPSMWYK